MSVSKNIGDEIKNNINEDKNLYYKMNQINKDKLKRDDNERRRKRAFGFGVSLLILLVFAILNMFSVNFYMIYSKGIKYFRNYLAYIGLAICFFGTGAFINYKFYNKKRIAFIILVGSLGILLFVLFAAKFLPNLVPKNKGAYGWIKLPGFTIQPAEFLKLPFIIILARLFERAEKEKFRNMEIFLYIIPIPVLFGVFIYLQGDLGTTLHYICILLFMMFLSKIDMRLIIAVVSAGVVVVSGAFYWIYNFVDLTGAHFRLRRITSFITGLLTNEYDNAIGYQVGQSLIAFGSGGIIGKNFGNGVQKYKYLPEVSTDFILASYGEELGFLGMFILIVLFLVIFNIIKSIAMDTKDYFGKYLAMGIGGYIITQVLINIYVALGMLPVFGIPMPIFSYGGSSLVTVFASLGIILNINNHKDNRL